MPARKAAAVQTPEIDVDAMLGKLNTVTTAPPPKGSKGGDVDVLTIPELADYAGIDYSEKQSKALNAGPTVGAIIRERTIEYFVAKGIELGSCPKNPKGVDGEGVGEASLQMRKSTSKLDITKDAETIEAFEAIDVPLEHVVLAPHTLRMKPELYADKAKLRAIITALSEANLPWDEWFETQLPNEHYCIHDDTMPTLFRRAKEYAKSVADGNPNNTGLTPERVRELVGKCASPSIRPLFHGSLPDAIVALIRASNIPMSEITAAYSAAEEKAKAKQETKPTPVKPKRK